MEESQTSSKKKGEEILQKSCWQNKKDYTFSSEDLLTLIIGNKH